MTPRGRTDTTKRTLVGLLLIAASCSAPEERSNAPDGGEDARWTARDTEASFSLEPAGWGRRLVVDDTGFRLAGDETHEVASAARLGWGRELGVRSTQPRLRARSEDRIEVDLGWSVGVLAKHPRGLEQSWEIAARPSTPALEVRVPIERVHHLGSGEDGLVFRTEHHEYLLYGHAVWIDAEGDRTPVPSHFDGDEIVLTVGSEVLDRSAYPAVLDPIVGTARSLTPTQLTNATVDQENPAIATGATTRLVVWSDDRNGVTPGVFGTFRDSTGTLAERYAFRIGRARLTGTAVEPSVAYAAGTYLVVWATFDTVLAARVAESGEVLDETPLVVSEGGTPRGATVTTDGATLLVTWHDDGQGIRARRVSTDGALLGEPIWVHRDIASIASVRAVHDPAGGYWVVFDESSSGDREVALVRLAADGTVRDPGPVALAPSFGDQTQADLAFASAGSAMVVYQDSSTRAVHGVTVTEAPDGTLALGTPTRISGGSGEQRPRVVRAGSQYHVGWISSAPGTPSPQVATIASPVRVDGFTLGPGIGYRIALAVDATSTVHAVWESRNDDTDGIDVYRRARPPSSGAWASPTYLVSQAPARQHSPMVANDDARSLAAWVETTPGGVRVYATRINPLGELEDVAAFPVGNESVAAVMIGVYSNGADFLVAWHAQDTRSGGSLGWVPMVARVSTAGVVSPAIACSSPSTSRAPAAVWLDRSVFPTRYVVTHVSGDVLYNRNVGTSSCGSRFLYEADTVVGATELVATPNAVYWVSRGGTLYRVNQTMAPAGGSGAPVPIDALDVDTLDVLAGTSDTLTYSSSPPRFPLDERVGVVRIGATGDVQWHVPDLAEHVTTTTNPQIARIPDGTFVVWRQTTSSLVGRRLTTTGERMDSARVPLDGEPYARYLGDVVTDFLDRATLVYSASLPEQGWATRLRVRAIDFRAHEGRALGAACSTGFDCASGNCADGVCCNVACGYSRADDCQACAIAAGATSDGTCSTLAVGTECRASAGECDVAERCDGIAVECPLDALAAADSACGTPSDGPCDLADRCNGASVSCEARGFADAGTSCRPSRGGCDDEDTCDGTQAACPDVVLPAGVVCRPARGACDVAEICDGATDACPGDEVATAGVPCRAAVGECDVEETCDGASVSCPVDALRDATHVCRVAAGPCDRDESCDGATPACPSDLVLEAGTECRPASGECDLADRCDGRSAGCVNILAANGSACGSGGLACESASCAMGVCTSSPVVCADGARCSEATGGCPEPSTGGGGCRSSGRGDPEPIGGLVAMTLVVVLARRRRNDARADHSTSGAT